MVRFTGLMATILILVNGITVAHAKQKKVRNDAELFTIGAIVFGRTTLEEAAHLLGETSVVEPEHPEVERDHLCYKQQVGHETWFLAISADYPQRNQPVTGFRVATHFHDWQCITPKIDLTTLSSGNGVRLGLTKTEFVGKFPFAFDGTDTSLFVDRHTYGKGPCENSKRTCKRIYLESFHAKFSDGTLQGKLIDYEVVRTLAVF